MKYILLAIFSLSSCATSPINNSKDFSSYNNEDLCLAAKSVSSSQDEKVIQPYLQELLKRNLMDESKFATVNTVPAVVGDSKCYMFATYGTPRGRNITSTKDKDYYQYRYKNFFGNFTYIYTKDNVITAIQN